VLKWRCQWRAEDKLRIAAELQQPGACSAGIESYDKYQYVANSHERFVSCRFRAVVAMIGIAVVP
jgi:hypothetical protein